MHKEEIIVLVMLIVWGIFCVWLIGRGVGCG